MALFLPPNRLTFLSAQDRQNCPSSPARMQDFLWPLSPDFLLLILICIKESAGTSVATQHQDTCAQDPADG
ncbi:MAG: hypothetical protein SOY88_02235 [Massilioclostridium sp.]|nr:hypothetical protein [Massilioclostridium sp.]